MSARLTDETDGSALPDFLLPTPSAQESTPTDEFLDEFAEHLDPDDPLHRLWLPGRKWMTQRTLSRTVPALLPTPGANDANGAEKETRERRQDEGSTGGPSLRDLPKLLPTPTTQDGENTAGPSTRERNSAPLNLVAADAAEGKLLPTPTAGDAKSSGSRNLEGSMSAAGKRPSGQKATLPLGTAVGMRETISETPFTEDTAGQVTLLPTPTAEDGERGRNGSGPDRLGTATFDSLLPTPVANEENPGAGGELRAAVVHGEGRRNETGTDTMGRPNTGRPSKLLPTPTAADGENASEQGPRHYIEGTDNPTLLGAARRTTGELRHSDDPDLLPTPTAGDGREPSDHPAPGPAVLKDAAQEIAWGVYEAAIRRWERILGREAPTPTDEKGRLAPAFVEWMLGYPLVLNWKPEEMTKDEFIAAAIAGGAITVDAEQGKVYALRGSGGKRLDEPREIGTLLESGYLAASIRIGSTRKMCRLHRVIWIAANGIPADDLCVCHRNNVKTDNQIGNLYLATSEQNSADAARDGLLPSGEENVATKIDAETRARIADEYAAGGVFQYELAERYGISKSRVSQICAEEGWISAIAIPRTAQLRILGNSVQVQVSEQVGFWLVRLTLTGVL